MHTRGADYLHILQQLLPPGAAWPREAEATLTKLLEALAQGLALVHNRAEALIEEADPRTTAEMLTDWERVAGLPDPCSGLAETVQERRAAVVAKLTSRGGQSIAFLEALAAAYGFTVTVSEFRPFRAGINRAGDPLNGEWWPYVFQINAPETTITYFRAGQSAAGEPLRKWGNELLECVISRVKPAHTDVIFAYGA